MKKYAIIFLLLFISILSAAQQFNDTVNAFLLPEELFRFSTDNLNHLFSDNWETAEILGSADWVDSEVLSGEDLDRADCFWKYITIPDYDDLKYAGKTDIKNPVVIVESYETEVRVFVQGKELSALGKPAKNRIGYQYFFLPSLDSGTPVFFRVESNPLAGEEIYLSDKSSITDSPGQFLLLYFYDEMVPFIFGILTLLTGLGMILFFIFRLYKKNYFLLWFGLFSSAFGVFTLFNTNLINILIAVEPAVDFYVPLLAQDLLPVFLMLFYISFMENSWRKLFSVLISGQLFVLLIHLFIMITGFFSEWSDLLSILFPSILFITVTLHLFLRNRKSKFSKFFYSAFLVLAARNGLEFLVEIGLDSAAGLIIYGSILFYIILGSLPYYSYLLQGIKIKEQNIAFRRFVPDEFLNFLSRKDITNINLGDHTRKTLTILFTDIRSFTAISEQMTPEENFNFINKFLGAVGPIIRVNSGFIDKYIGDAVMAIFPDNPSHAVEAGIQMLEKVQELNSDGGSSSIPEIKIGIGIHTGDTMLGIIGEKERYDSTVISDAVNLASRLEGLTKRLGQPLLMSETTASKVSGTYQVHGLGMVQIRGKEEAIRVFTLKSLVMKG